MQKSKKLLLFLFLIPLLLSGCGKGSEPTDSNNPSSEVSESSEIVSDTTSDESSDNPSSEIVSDTTSQESSDDPSSEIASSSDDPDDTLLTFGYTRSEAWPSAEVNTFLTDYNVPVTIPALSFTEKTYFRAEPGSAEDYPHFLIIAPGLDYTTDYQTRLHDASFATYFVTGEDYYTAYEQTELVFIDFSYRAAEESYPAGMYIDITLWVDSEDIGEGAPAPSNPLSKITFSFQDTSQIVGGKDVNLTTWNEVHTSFSVAKGTSTVGVGNYNIPENNNGEGYFDHNGAFRIYDGQIVTFESHDALIEQIVFWTTESKYTVALLSANYDGVTTYTLGTIVTLVTNTPSSVFEINATAQFRLTAIDIYFAQ